MVINGYRNKPIGPGGGTRRLHHFLLVSSDSANAEPAGRHGNAPGGRLAVMRVAGCQQVWGRNRIDEGVKGTLLPGMIPPLSGQLIVANDNYAEVAIAA
jgi:hypothetical protein